MNQFQPRHRMWRYWTMGLAVFVAMTGAASRGQTPTGAVARPPANTNAPLMVLPPKAKPAGWTGVHKPHTKLGDVLTRHKGQTDWAETILDDESLFAQWISMGPGTTTPRRMNGDTREWWIVQSGTLRKAASSSSPPRACGAGAVSHVLSDRERGHRPGARRRGERDPRAQAVSMDETPAPVKGTQRAVRITTERWTRIPGSRSAATVPRRPPSSTAESCWEVSLAGC